MTINGDRMPEVWLQESWHPEGNWYYHKPSHNDDESWYTVDSGASSGQEQAHDSLAYRQEEVHDRGTPSIASLAEIMQQHMASLQHVNQAAAGTVSLVQSMQNDLIQFKRENDAVQSKVKV